MKRSGIIILFIVLSIVVVSLALFAFMPKKAGAGFKADAAYRNGVAKYKQGKLEEAAIELRGALVDEPDTEKAPEIFFLLGEIYQKQEKLLDARRSYKKIVDNYLNSPYAPRAQERLGNINVAVLYSPYISETSKVYKVLPGENLTSIAKKFNTTVELLMKSNGLKDTNLRAGQDLKVPVGRFSVIVDKTQNTLTLKLNEEIFKMYRVSTGKQTTPTPVGEFKVVNKMVDPVWYSPKDGPIPPEDPRNILGTRWLGLTKAGYGIHGTTQPESIGKAATAGCVRMLNTDVEEVYDILPIGTQVTIIE